MTKKRLILVELNEINFDAVYFYIGRGVRLPGFEILRDQGIVVTESEQQYANLEPWIQWPSVHTGKTFDEHKIFRLGDVINSRKEQFFEKVERAGFLVGAVSPMNASNALDSPAYFIPDPWTQTSCDDSFFSKAITAAIVQSVNDNSQSRLTVRTIINLGLSFFALVKPIRFFPIIKYALGALGKPWRKALFLDMLLHEIHMTLFKRKSADFSTLFLNAGAHIQHHYFLNSPFVGSPVLVNPSWYVGEGYDPLLEMLKVYDDILVDILDVQDTEVIVATGLSQKACEQAQFYYRLKDHRGFLKYFDVKFNDVVPRMTRDFLVSFDSVEQASLAEKQLSEIFVNNEVKLFEEIDNRGKDIFVVLTYPSEITKNCKITGLGKQCNLLELVTFVAIKNGEHQGKGFAYFSDGIAKYSPPQGSHVSKIHDTVVDFFGVS
tara:strand:+ start:13554 stop:14858 length:1305 start_codon:yes stop_codon:yes gene_type:complete